MSKYGFEIEKSSFPNCFITTGISSLKFYNRSIHFDIKKDALLYSCMSIESIRNISRADKYYIVIDFRDKHVEDILFNLLDYILPLNPEICIKVVKQNETEKSDNIKSMKLLKRLSKYNIINLDLGTASTEKKETLSLPLINRLRALIN